MVAGLDEDFLATGETEEVTSLITTVDIGLTLLHQHDVLERLDLLVLGQLIEGATLGVFVALLLNEGRDIDLSLDLRHLDVIGHVLAAALHIGRLDLAEVRREEALGRRTAGRASDEVVAVAALERRASTANALLGGLPLLNVASGDVKVLTEPILIARRDQENNRETIGGLSLLDQVHDLIRIELMRAHVFAVGDHIDNIAGHAVVGPKGISQSVAHSVEEARARAGHIIHTTQWLDPLDQSLRRRLDLAIEANEGELGVLTRGERPDLQRLHDIVDSVDRLITDWIHRARLVEEQENAVLELDRGRRLGTTGATLLANGRSEHLVGQLYCPTRRRTLELDCTNDGGEELLLLSRCHFGVYTLC